uniref:Uncharacterized protein n=1 Tax=Ditylenchus dipsaci TaxID=166011 RepID=A0A915CMC1_9BILA
MRRKEGGPIATKKAKVESVATLFSPNYSKQKSQQLIIGGRQLESSAVGRRQLGSSAVERRHWDRRHLGVGSWNRRQLTLVPNSFKIFVDSLVLLRKISADSFKKSTDCIYGFFVIAAGAGATFSVD